MWSKTLVGLSLVGVLYGCNLPKEERAKYQSKVDSLTTELETSHKAVTTLQDVAILMDSIDMNRKALKTHLTEGTTYEDFNSRMQEINKYVKHAYTRIAQLEDRVKGLKSSSSGYKATIKKMKDEMDARNLELASLQEEVNRYRSENDNLLQTVDLQRTEINNKLDQLKLKASQIDTLERKVNTMIADARVDEADAYYKQAQAVEETANRTKFAPRKKRNTRREALELYKLAAFYGKDEAQAKIAELEQKI